MTRRRIIWPLLICLLLWGLIAWGVLRLIGGTDGRQEATSYDRIGGQLTMVRIYAHHDREGFPWDDGSSLPAWEYPIPGTLSSLAVYQTALRPSPGTLLDGEPLGPLGWFVPAQDGRRGAAEEARSGLHALNPDPQVGRATWYTGKGVNPEAFTCAHRTAPRDSWLRVTCLSSRKSFKVRVTDRGPNTETHGRNPRVIDLTPAAFRALGVPLSKGVVQVEVTEE